MSAQVLQHNGVVAVCFGCGAEKKQAFGACPKCSALPRQEDEITDSLVLSRYCSSELLLSQAVAERSPGLVIKAAQRSTMREVAKALRDPQLRRLLSLPCEDKQVAGTAEPSHCANVERLVQFAQAEISSETSKGIKLSLSSDDQLSTCGKNELLLRELRNDLRSASSGVLLELIEDVAQRCRQIDAAELKRYLSMSVAGGIEASADEQRELWERYQQSLLDRIVVLLERVDTENLIDLFQRLQISTERRRDKQALPLIKSLMAVYQSHAFETLRLEADNAAKLLSAIRSCGADESALVVAMIGELESLIANWRKVAMPLTGDNADREVAGVRRELQRSLQNVADFLSGERSDDDSSVRVSRLALELL